MLCLMRKPQQRIYIGDDITILVIEIGHGEVRLGIEAPKHITIERDDCKNRKKKCHDSID